MLSFHTAQVFPNVIDATRRWSVCHKVECPAQPVSRQPWDNQDRNGGGKMLATRLAVACGSLQLKTINLGNCHWTPGNTGARASLFGTFPPRSQEVTRSGHRRRSATSGDGDFARAPIYVRTDSNVHRQMT